MHSLKLLWQFAKASIQNEFAYRANFWISLLHSLLNLGTGVISVTVLFGQIETIKGWKLPSALALLGVYLILSALRGLFIGPSLEALAGMDGEIWSGKFDFTLLRPVNVQFLASIRYWRPLALVDLLLALGVMAAAIFQLGTVLTFARLIAFLVTLGAGITILYAILLAFSALVLWSPGFLFTWLFNAFFQMARYPVSLYPGWLRLILTWIVPVGVMTTVPAQALSGDLSPGMLIGSFALAVTLFAGSSILFHVGLERYASASS
ncbi:MAG: ABC-2 family transporter protein [Anaerolineae bacterium]|nr:ABC-2 family transporter protein [Anaerolineae bacterium]